MFRSFDPLARFREITSAPDVCQPTRPLDVDKRFPRLVGLRSTAIASFGKQKIAVVGTGSIGRRIALHLTRLGIGKLWLVDPDRYDDRVNLVTQEILATNLGESKAVSTGKACKSISPVTRVFAYEGKVQDLDPITMAEADAVFLATDNLAVEVDASHQFRLLGIPIVQASVHGETLVVQVRFTENKHSDGPCLICSYGPEEYRHLNQSSRFRCTGMGPSGASREQIQVMPTMSTSFLCSQAADFAMTQWTRHTLGLGQPVTDTLLQYCGYTHQLTQAKLVRRKHCRNGHVVLRRLRLPLPLEGYTVRELARYAGTANDAQECGSLTLGDLSYVHSAVCLCKEHRVERFAASGRYFGRCAACNERITPQPYYLSRPTPFSDLKSQQDRLLRCLGGEAAAWAVIQYGDRGVLLRSNYEMQSPTDNELGKTNEV